MTVMTKPVPQKSDQIEQSISCALLDGEDCAVVRVVGRGNFLNSVPLKRFADHLNARNEPKVFILDLQECETLDSTFMGVIASVSITQTRGDRHKLVVANASDHIRRLLKTLGLTHLLDLRDGSSQKAALERASSHLRPADDREVTRTEQILHTLDAHKTLVKIDEENELRFQSVIHYLEQSLKNAADGGEDVSV